VANHHVPTPPPIIRAMLRSVTPHRAIPRDSPVSVHQNRRTMVKISIYESFRMKMNDRAHPRRPKPIIQ
jgi:hypothetical protein